MKRLIIILTLFLVFTNCALCAEASKTVTKDIKTVTKDGFSMRAVLEYPKTQDREYKTVVLLHSLGYNSGWWEDLPQKFLDRGYAVLKIDLRGHGGSVYNSKLTRISWKSMTNRAYARYPDDVIQVIEQVKTDNNKKIFFENWAIVGADIGASTGVIVANKVEYKPKTIVMLSPVVSTKGLYIPVKLAELDNIDIFTICGTGDYLSRNAQDYLKKFAQASFSSYTSESHSMGMLMLKNDGSLSNVISEWVAQYLK